MQSLKNLIDDALDGKIYFDEFSEKAQKLGLESCALVATGVIVYRTRRGQSGYIDVK
jgi:hypothetical protein